MTSRSVVLFLLLGAMLGAQERNPFANNPKAAKLGEFQFRINCSFCHGLGARGGGRGPDLTLAKKRHGATDSEMFHNIKDGIAGTAMPAAIGSIGVGMTDAEVWQVVTYLRSVQVKTPAHPAGECRARRRTLFQARPDVFGLPHGAGKRRPSGAGSDRYRQFALGGIDGRVHSQSEQRLSPGLRNPPSHFLRNTKRSAVVTADGRRRSPVSL